MLRSEPRHGGQVRPARAAAPASAFAADVALGLSSDPKRLPSKYLYDAEGSRLFELICAQPEYYLTRTELALMHAHAEAMARELGPGVRLVEYGCGAGTKARLLLSHLERPAGYLAVDVSGAALAATVGRMKAAIPSLEVRAVRADFTAPHALPELSRPAERTVVYFPGSTIGNFETDDAVALLRRMREEMGPGGAALVGMDLKKDESLLNAAYNDRAGVTAAFTLNILTRINRELGGTFDVASYRHDAAYSAAAGRIETHIVSLRDQVVRVGGRRHAFARDEAMRVEVSAKYDRDDIARLAARAGLAVSRSWTDDHGWFANVLLEPAPVSAPAPTASGAGRSR